VHLIYIKRTTIRTSFKRGIVDDSVVLEEMDRDKKVF